MDGSNKEAVARPSLDAGIRALQALGARSVAIGEIPHLLACFFVIDVAPRPRRPFLV